MSTKLAIFLLVSALAVSACAKKTTPPGEPGVCYHVVPQQDGSLQLVAVENLVFIRAWEAAGNLQPPSYQGVPYDLMRDDPATPADEAHMFEPHYDRHVWLYRENPNGMFAQFNPNVSCANGKNEMASHGAHGGDR